MLHVPAKSCYFSSFQTILLSQNFIQIIPLHNMSLPIISFLEKPIQASRSSSSITYSIKSVIYFPPYILITSLPLSQLVCDYVAREIPLDIVHDFRQHRVDYPWILSARCRRHKRCRSLVNPLSRE